MLFVDPSRHQRSKLTAAQREFFLRIVPLAGFLQQQTYNKALVTDKLTDSGIYASLLAAHMLYKTEFGAHPLAQLKCGNCAANNLALLETHKYWKKMSIKYEGKVFRAYTNWREFAIDFSDFLAWQAGFEDVLEEKLLINQIQAFATREKNVAYVDKIVRIIKDYGLREFDWHAP